LYPYLIWLAVASSITFILYGLDKAQSKRKGRRVPEVAFHGLALAGGFISGWVGRSLFHHKTKKGVFLFVLIVSTVIHARLAYWLFKRQFKPHRPFSPLRHSNTFASLSINSGWNPYNNSVMCGNSCWILTFVRMTLGKMGRVIGTYW
jgi:uncharacterized membrane protein YsdA (DUF1294 family)